LPVTQAWGYPQDVENPDEWARFLARYLDNRATNVVHNGIGLVALHIVDAIKEARKYSQDLLKEAGKFPYQRG
jgi:hypothetical protein